MLTAEVPLHLEERLDAATVEGSAPPATAPEVVEWRFDEPQPGWRPVAARGAAAVEALRSGDALRLPLTVANPHPYRPDRLEGYVYVDLPAWLLDDWGYVEIRARASRGMRNLGLMFNHTEDDPQEEELPFYTFGERTALVSDGTEQTYRLSLATRRRPLEGPWTHLGLWFNGVAGEGPVALELLSIRVIPAAAEYAGQSVGVRTLDLARGGDPNGAMPLRRALFTHAPGTVAFDLRVPSQGRLDLGLGVLSRDAPVKFAVTATTRAGGSRTLLEETWDDPVHWAQRSVNLAALDGQTVTLALSAEGEREGSVAFWAAPTVSGARTADLPPNVILYVIDSGGADYMSAYDYNRRTTPYLERLAAEGTLFERAHSNASHTRPSTASFLTSLQHSVLGELRGGRSPVPDGATTMAEHFHRAGYQTALLTTNPNAGRMSNLERGTDLFRDTAVRHEQESAASLHRTFWKWREDYPGEPYFVHFQTTDVHEPHDPPAPFAGMFLGPEGRARVEELEERIDAADVWGPTAQRRIGADWTVYASGKRDLYDEAMAHQDDQIHRLVDRLKARGERRRTLLIVAADHGSAAGSQDWQTLLLDPVPEAYDFSQRGTPILRAGVSRVPLIFVWPGRIVAGERIAEPVSMLDVLPTLLELAGLPAAEVSQGRSLAPVLLGTGNWEPRPVILDEFEADRETGELGGRIEIVDGRWGASLEIGAKKDSTDPGDHRPAPLLLCDLWVDPLCVDSRHEEHPDLVEHYTRFLERQFRSHQDLGKLFARAADSPLTPEQLESLRALGYVQ